MLEEDNNSEKERKNKAKKRIKSKLEKVEKEVAQIKKSIDRRARAMSSTPKTKEDAETWELIAKYAAQELATHQEELAAIQEKMEDTKKQIEAVRAASTRISEEVFDEDEIQGRGCCAGPESYLDAVSYWFTVE